MPERDEGGKDRALELLDSICQDCLDSPLSHVDGMTDDDLANYGESAKFKELRDLIARPTLTEPRTKGGGMTEKELTNRAKREPDGVLRLWLHDGRRLVQKVARRELKNRGFRP